MYAYNSPVVKRRPRPHLPIYFREDTEVSLQRDEVKEKHLSTYFSDEDTDAHKDMRLCHTQRLASPDDDEYIEMKPPSTQECYLAHSSIFPPGEGNLSSTMDDQQGEQDNGIHGFVTDTPLQEIAACCSQLDNDDGDPDYETLDSYEVDLSLTYCYPPHTCSNEATESRNYASSSSPSQSILKLESRHDCACTSDPSHIAGLDYNQIPGQASKLTSYKSMEDILTTDTIENIAEYTLTYYSNSPSPNSTCSLSPSHVSPVSHSPSHLLPSHLSLSHLSLSHLSPSHLSPSSSHLSLSHLSPSHLSPSHLSPSHLSSSHLSPSHLSPLAPPESRASQMFLTPLPSAMRSDTMTPPEVPVRTSSLCESDHKVSDQLLIQQGKKLCALLNLAPAEQRKKHSSIDTIKSALSKLRKLSLGQRSQEAESLSAASSESSLASNCSISAPVLVSHYQVFPCSASKCMVPPDVRSKVCTGSHHHCFGDMDSPVCSASPSSCSLISQHQQLMARSLSADVLNTISALDGQNRNQDGMYPDSHRTVLSLPCSSKKFPGFAKTAKQHHMHFPKRKSSLQVIPSQSSHSSAAAENQATSPRKLSANQDTNLISLIDFLSQLEEESSNQSSTGTSGRVFKGKPSDVARTPEKRRNQRGRKKAFKENSSTQLVGAAGPKSRQHIPEQLPSGATIRRLPRRRKPRPCSLTALPSVLAEHPDGMHEPVDSHEEMPGRLGTSHGNFMSFLTPQVKGTFTFASPGKATPLTPDNYAPCTEQPDAHSLGGASVSVLHSHPSLKQKESWSSRPRASGFWGNFIDTPNLCIARYPSCDITRKQNYAKT